MYLNLDISFNLFFALFPSVVAFASGNDTRVIWVSTFLKKGKGFCVLVNTYIILATAVRIQYLIVFTQKSFLPFFLEVDE